MDDYTRLVAEAQSPNQQTKHAAFNQLMRDFQAMAYRYAYSTLGDIQLAEDATQEAFLLVYERIGQLRDPRAFPGWLKRIVYTQCDRVIRRKQPRLESIDSQYDLADDIPAVEQVLEDDEIKDQIHSAVDALPDHERDVTEGFYFNGETQRELSERLNIPITTVKKRLQYARLRLRGVIADLNDTLDRALTVQQPQQEYQPIPIRKRRDEDYL